MVKELESRGLSPQAGVFLFLVVELLSHVMEGGSKVPVQHVLHRLKMLFIVDKRRLLFRGSSHDFHCGSLFALGLAHA